MATKKAMPRKVRMLRAGKSNRRVPAWVMQRTNRRFTSHPKRRNWRRGTLKK